MNFKNFIKVRYFPFILLFVTYIILFFSVKLVADDSTLFGNYQNLTLNDHWDLILKDYYYWSSRVLVNAVIHFLLGKSKYIFVFANATLITLLALSLSKLFVKSQKTINHIFIISFILLFPLQHLSSAGWLVTVMTYLWPTIFGFIALIPIYKINNEEPFKWYEYIVYSFSLIYAGNLEVMLVCLLLVYFVFAIYFIIKKKHYTYSIIQLCLLVGSLIFIMTTPGNSMRSLSEIETWFPTYLMLDIVDKIDVGFFVIMQNIIFDVNMAVAGTTFIMMCVILKKYKLWSIRIIGITPFAIIFACGILRKVSLLLFDKYYIFSGSISNDGLITILTGHSFALIRFLLVVIFAFSFIATLILCLENLFKNLFGLSLLFSGVASRVMLGFSPTIHASKFRTATPLYFVIIAIGILIFSDAIEHRVFNKKEIRCILILAVILAIIVTILNGRFISGGSIK